MERCDLHPYYRGLRKPRHDCEKCMELYLKNRERGIKEKRNRGGFPKEEKPCTENDEFNLVVEEAVTAAAEEDENVDVALFDELDDSFVDTLDEDEDDEPVAD